MQGTSPRNPSSKTNALNREIDKILKTSQKITSKLGNKLNLYAGLIKEELLRELLVMQLKNDLIENQNIKIGTGFIINELGNTSKQIDIIVYKSNNDKIFFESPNFVLTAPENVFATIEVKSTLNGKHIKDALANQHSVFEVNKESNHKIIKCIIGFKRSFTKNASLKQWLDLFYQNISTDNINIFEALPTLISSLAESDVFHFGQAFPSIPSFFTGMSPEGISGFQTFYVLLLRELYEEGLDIPGIDEYLNMISGEEYRSENLLGIDWQPFEIEFRKTPK